MPEFNKHSNGPSDTPQQPHRCNGHLEDVLVGLSSWPMDVSKPFGVFLQCLKSQPGNKARERDWLELAKLFKLLTTFLTFLSITKISRTRTSSLFPTTTERKLK
ncbi:hypothetical protein BDB00DRAFT_815458 [Zychaea mexicana]|uniref:uncharacterized protein n=1 Tax=Zychaea mexicana TaxID=64656 RepID=UPI0022FF3386|nr:uncharacterized protein BDB00DRAFT_815458 [Zychaea mexicana]KAI9495007.1 hypothetical protein BDB00DRAFT_815458 [Zychaea mexicana]